MLNGFRKKLPPRSVTLVASATAISLLGDQALYAILPVYFRQLHLIPFQVGVLLSINRWIRLLTNHPAERLTGRFSPTRLLVIALVLGAFLTATYGGLPLFPVLLTARVLWGLCWSFIRQIGIMTTADSASDENVGRLIGFYNGIARVGSMVGAFLGALLYDIIGFCSTFLILGAISLLAAIPGGAARRGLHRHESRFARPRKHNSTDHVSGLLICGFVIGCVGPGLIMSTLGYVLRERIGESFAIGAMVIGIATVNGLLLACRHLANSLGAPFFGALLDRVGHRTGAFTFFAAATVILLAATIASSIPSLFCLVLGFFVCAACLQVALAAQAGRRGSRTYASYATALDLGMAIGPVLGWTVFEFVSLPTISFAIGCGLYAIGAAASLKAFKGNGYSISGAGPQKPVAG